MRKILALAAPLAILAMPASGHAQTAEPEAEQQDDIFPGMAALMGAFTVEPLTPEQQARLPRAQALVEMVLPPGALGETMDSMFSGFLGPLSEVVAADARAYLAGKLGMASYELDIDDERAAAAAALLDPAWQERQRREAELVPAVMQRMMAAMEPTMRTAMAELYAIHFDDRELADIAAFFATPSGASYARQSLSMASDQRVIAASMSAMPMIFESMASMEAEMAAATADLPVARNPQDLDEGDRKRMAGLLGMTPAEFDERIFLAPPVDAVKADGDW